MDENIRVAAPNCCSIYVTDRGLSDQITAILEDVSHYITLEDKTTSGDRFSRHVVIVMEPEYTDELMTIVGSLVTYSEEINKNITDIYKIKKPIIWVGYRSY